MPDLAPVPKDLKVREFLEYYALGYGIGTPAERKKRVTECLEITAMSDKAQSWCHELSRGQTQRVVLAKTLLHRPKVLILDEPASGLDPLARRELRQALRDVASAGATVFVSSHILTELAEMCTSVCVMNQGKLLASGTADAVREQLGSLHRTLTAAPLGRVAELADWLQQRPGLTTARVQEDTVVFDFHGSSEAQADLLEAMLKAGFRLRSLSEQRASFEELLLNIATSNRQN
jgi:ABC-2 type transport system ATP-binding protein